MTTKTAQKDNAALVATAQAGAIATINFDYLQPLEIGQSGYPSIQASKYRNLSEDSVIQLGLPTKSVDLIGDAALSQLKAEIIAVKFSKLGEEEPFYVPSDDIRWVPLAFPKPYVQDDSDEKGSVYKHQGSEWNAKCNSVYKLFLCAVSDNKLVTLDDGTPAIFTLKLKGKGRSVRINGKDGSLLSLNSALCKHYGVKGLAYIGHLASIKITVKPTEVVSGKDSSLASIVADFVFSDAKLLPQDIQAVTTALVREDVQLMSAIADPFNISGSSLAAATLMEDGEHPF
jgi:hypothetical protein